MKKIVAMIMGMFMALSLAACDGIPGITNGATATPEAAGVGMPNPMKEAESAEAFQALGIAMDAPDGAENVKYFIISDKIADVTFTLGGTEYTYRAAKTTDDISGVNDTLTEAFTMYLTYDFDNLTAVAYTGGEGSSLVKWNAQGVSYTLYAAAAVEEATLRQTVKAAMSKSLANVADAVGEADGVVAFKPEDTLSIDLDGDGTMETITTQNVKDEYGTEKLKVIVTPQKGDAKELQTDIEGFGSGFVFDTDGDGLKEVFVSGDVCSCDYEIWLFHFVGGEIVMAQSSLALENVTSVAGGNVLAIDASTSVVTVEDSVDIMGTWGCTTEYRVTSDPFTLTRVPDSVWKHTIDNEYWDYCGLITVKEVPYAPVGGGENALLPLGEKLALVETDGATYFHFITKSGIEGKITLTFSTDESFWGYTIDGVPEADYFETVPYAG